MVKGKKERSWNSKKTVAALIVLLILLAIFFLFFKRPHPSEPISTPLADSSMHQTAGTARIQEMRDTILLDTTKSRSRRISVIDPVIQASGTDTVMPDTMSTSIYVDSCAGDTIKPWVTPDPAGGLHVSPPSIMLFADKACKIEYRLGREGIWQEFAGKPIVPSGSVTLFFRAEDFCGNKTDERSAVYEIRNPDPLKRCPPDMVFVDAGDRSVCVDRYEWPNIKGVKPRASISLYQAADSCFLASKRLCTSPEWTAACAGPDGLNFPYGNEYQPRICTTDDSSSVKSGSHSECRSWYGAFDMSGNLAEWTSTKATGNEGFNNVMGGFWESEGQSTCGSPRYSYYPRNRHNPVGFRCCKDPQKK